MGLTSMKNHLCSFVATVQLRAKSVKKVLKALDGALKAYGIDYTSL